MWEYAINSGAWSIGGLVVGYVLGRMERQITDIKKRVDERDDDSREA
jgi:hypothetical protein